MNTPPNAPKLPSTGRLTFAQKVIDIADVPPPSATLPEIFGPYLIKGAIHWATGATGIGKSTFAYNLVAALAEGLDLWDYPCTACRVLYVDLESGEEGRARKVEKLYGDRPRPRDRVFFLPHSVTFPEDLSELLAFVHDHQIDLVIFDTARQCFGVRDENSNSEVYERIVPVLNDLKLMGVASLVFAHPAKNGAPGARGASAQEDFGDVNLTLTMHRGAVNNPNGIIVVEITKHRLLGYGQPKLYLKRAGNDLFVPVSTAEAGPSDSVSTGSNTARSRCANAVIAHLQAGPVPKPSFTGLVKAMVAVGHTEGTAKAAVSELLDRGRIVKAKNTYSLPVPTDFDDDSWDSLVSSAVYS